MSSASTTALIEQAVKSFISEVPALEKLKLVFGLELRGRGDVQIFRVEVPGPKISKSVADDARVTVTMPRSHFNELAADGRLKHYHEAWEAGHIQVSGDPGIQKLIAQVIARREERDHTPKAR